MADVDVDNYCDVWEVDEVRAEDELLEVRIFSIDVQASFTFPNPDAPVDEYDLLDVDFLESLQYVDTVRNHKVPYDFITKYSRTAIHNMLASMNIPVESFFVRKISACVTRMSAKESYKNRKVLRMGVSIDVIVGENPFIEEKSASKAASKEAIEGLENIVIDDDSNDCTICLQKFSKRVEAKRLPCRHTFHGNCIISWLGMRNFCPVCRYELLAA